MQIYLSTLCFFIILTGVQYASAQSTDRIREHFRILNSHDLKAQANEYANDAQVFSPNWEGAKVGPSAITEAYTRYYKTTPDLTYRVSNMIRSGDNVIVQYSSSGTMVKPEAGRTSLYGGQKNSLQNCVILVLKNNKIVRETNYFDQIAFLRQVGFFDRH
jgi:predicted ester cyclase